MGLPCCCPAGTPSGYRIVINYRHPRRSATQSHPPGVRRPATPRPAHSGDQGRLSPTCRDETRKHESAASLISARAAVARLARRARGSLPAGPANRIRAGPVAAVASVTVMGKSRAAWRQVRKGTGRPDPVWLARPRNVVPAKAAPRGQPCRAPWSRSGGARNLRHGRSLCPGRGRRWCPGAGRGKGRAHGGRYEGGVRSGHRWLFQDPDRAQPQRVTISAGGLRGRVARGSRSGRSRWCGVPRRPG